MQHGATPKEGERVGPFTHLRPLKEIPAGGLVPTTRDTKRKDGTGLQTLKRRSGEPHRVVQTIRRAILQRC